MPIRGDEFEFQSSFMAHVVGQATSVMGKGGRVRGARRGQRRAGDTPKPEP